MLKKIKSKWLKILIILLIVAVIAFAAVSIAWTIFYHSYVKPLKDSMCSYTQGLPSAPVLGSDITEWCTIDEDWDNSTMYNYQNYDNFAGHTLEVPHFLNFSVFIQSITPHYSEINSETNEMTRLSDYTYYFSYYRSLFRENFEFRIDDYRESNSGYENGTYMSGGPTASYLIETDKDMNFLSGNKAMYEEHYDELKRVYDEVKEIFGENAFE